MFQKANITDQIIELRGLEQGQLVTIVITEAASDCVLEFQHATDDWRVHPGFGGNRTDGVIIGEVRCISGSMRIRFLSAQTGYFISLVHAETAVW